MNLKNKIDKPGCLIWHENKYFHFKELINHLLKKYDKVK
jgi:hypothetical protein